MRVFLFASDTQIVRDVQVVSAPIYDLLFSESNSPNETGHFAPVQKELRDI